MVSSLDLEDYMEHRWSVRLASLAVVASIGTHQDGAEYLYIALDLGHLHYYPSMLAEGYVLDLNETCYGEFEALRTVHRHHISFCQRLEGLRFKPL